MFTNSEPVIKVTDLFWARKFLSSSSSSSDAIVPGANRTWARCHAVTWKQIFGKLLYVEYNWPHKKSLVMMQSTSHMFRQE